MTLRTASLRIDPVAVALDGQSIGILEEASDLGEVREAVVAWAIPRVPEDHDRGRLPSLQPARELGSQRPDARVTLVVEEVEVVQEACRLAKAELEERVNAAFGHVHHLHGGPRTVAAQRQQVAEVARDGGDTVGLLGDPRRVERVSALDSQHDDEPRPEHERDAAPELEGPWTRARGAVRADGSERSERAEKKRQRVELILPSLALEPEVEAAVYRSHHRESLSRGESFPRRRAYGEDRKPGEEQPQLPAILVPAERRPGRRAADATVEWKHVPDEDVHERPEPATPGEPSEHQRRDHQGCARQGGGRPRRRKPLPPGRADDGQDAADPEQTGVGLDGHGRSESEPADQQRRQCAVTLDGAGHAEDAGEEKQAEQEIALPDPPGAAAQVIEREERGSTGRGPATAHGPAKGEEEDTGRRQPPEIEEPPRQIPVPAHRERAQVNQIDARHVHVEHVAVRHRALSDEPSDIVHERSVVDERPTEGPPDEDAQQRHASGQNKLQ